MRTRGLTKHFGSVHALEDLDLDVRRGEVFGYLGPNGAGKTTTIRLLLDFIRPTSGTYSVLGAASGDTEVRRRIGYLPGELRLDPRYSAGDLVDFYGDLRGGLDRAYVCTLYERFDLDPARPAAELSTGNRRKIGIVQAFMHRPELLVLDEPTSGLDPLLQHEFQVLVRECVRDGATVFLSSHVLREVEALADRVGILRRGHLVTVAGVEELRTRARQRVELHVDGPSDASVFTGLPEVKDVVVADGVITLTVEGSMNQMLKAAARLDVLRITTHEADLEDVFLGYYKKDGE